MTAEIDKIFRAEARSTSQFLIEPGQGCYIPTYQRPYSWDNENISRLFEDVINGIRQVLERPDTISFLGTIIAVHDTKYQTVKPIYHSQVAPRVMVIIDGQQRISAIIISNIVLHDYIRRMIIEFENKTEKHFSWITEECTKTLYDLRKTYLIDQEFGEGNHRYYPRIIRAISDAWSKRLGEAKYESPIAKLIWEYIDFSESKNVKQFKFGPKDNSGNPIEGYKKIDNAFRFILKEVRQIIQSASNKYDFPDLVTATQEPGFSKGIWGFSLPDEIINFVAEKSGDTNYEKFCQLLRLVIFARYFNSRVALTIVTTENEDDAFDMFEALNTTGEPLTAFETLKPQVVNSETLQKYEHSPSSKLIDRIEGYLERYHKADEKQRITSEMLVSFALAETGSKLQKKLNAQRRYLRDEFKKLSDLNDIEKNRDFVRSIESIASFMNHAWEIKQGTDPSFNPLAIKDDEARVGIEVLRKINHTITIAPLSRFYQQARESNEDGVRKIRTDEFVAAIKATVAFSMLWRGAKGGTENIDSHYREIMRTGVNIRGETIPPLARRPNGRLGAVSLMNYKRALQLILEHRGEIKDKDEWVKLAARVGIYDHQKVIARFLLFCATDDAAPDKSQHGLLVRGRVGRRSMLNLDQWDNNDYFTVEHVAPQSKSAEWKDDRYKRIYDVPENIHKLGNLILLPAEANTIIGNKSWEHKRLMYRLLASETTAEFDKIKDELRAAGLTLSNTAKEVLDNAKYLSICKSVALYDKPWSFDIIQERTERFAELAWDRLYPWLYS